MIAVIMIANQMVANQMVANYLGLKDEHKVIARPPLTPHLAPSLPHSLTPHSLTPSRPAPCTRTPQVISDSLYPPLERYDPSSAQPLDDSSEARQDLANFKASWAKMDLWHVHGFPLWEQEVRP